MWEKVFSDEVLIKRISEGNKSAFTELYNRYKKDVMGLASRFMGSKMKAEDITQNVWFKVVEKAPQYSPTGKVKSWILTITKNECLNELNKNSRLNYEEDITEAETTKAIEFSEEFWENQSIEIVKKALDELPDRHRIVLVLFYYDNKSLKELANELGLNENAVKALLFRARENLKLALGTLND